MRASLLRNTGMVLCVAGAALVGASPALARSERRGAPNNKIGHGTSSNWSGYALSGGSYPAVSASWIQPAVNCAVTPTGYSAFWVGLDGDTTSTVEQTGTEAECSAGKAIYFGWYEMYPKAGVNYSDKILPGDSVSASVTYAGGASFALTLSDETRNWSHTTVQRLKSAKLGSAEVIAEAPSGKGGVLPLADFGTVSFTRATITGSVLTGVILGLEPISMISGGTLKAQPSAIAAGAFSDTWHHQ